MKYLNIAITWLSIIVIVALTVLALSPRLAYLLADKVIGG